MQLLLSLLTDRVLNPPVCCRAVTTRLAYFGVKMADTAKPQSDTESGKMENDHCVFLSNKQTPNKFVIQVSFKTLRVIRISRRI